MLDLSYASSLSPRLESELATLFTPSHSRVRHPGDPYTLHPIQSMWRLDKPITGCWNHKSWPCQEVASTQGQRIGLEKDGDKETTFHSSWYWSHPSALVMSKQQYLGEKQFSLISGFCLFQPHMERVNWERCKVPKIVITSMLFLDTANAYQVNIHVYSHKC